MRLNLILEAREKSLEFDYQNKLIRTFHSWLPGNYIHDDISLYSFSWLKGGKAANGSIVFPGKALWSISIYSDEIVAQTLEGIRRLPDTFFGMQVVNVEKQEAPVFSAKETFEIASPVLAKYFDGTRIRHKTFIDHDVDTILTTTMQQKLRIAGLSEDISIKFDRSYRRAKTKLVTIKNVKNKASMCPVIIKGKPESVAFAWVVGVGHCTGCGFGAIA